VVALLALASVVFAEDAPNRIDVAIGETVERDVGIALGLQCDDLSVIQVDLKTKAPAINTFIVKGLKEGTTLCRVGTDPNRPTFLYTIRVTAEKPEPPPPPPPTR
jgi:hypothetical protein